jgi:hypothetical protein
MLVYSVVQLPMEEEEEATASRKQASQALLPAAERAVPDTATMLLFTVRPLRGCTGR